MGKLIAGAFMFWGAIFCGFATLVYYGKPVIEQAVAERLQYHGYLH